MCGQAGRTGRIWLNEAEWDRPVLRVAEGERSLFTDALTVMSQMLKSSGAMGAATLLSRILGMAREVLYANFMGAGLVAGAFKLAFMIPNLFRRLLGEGALTAAFIPIFKDKEKNEGEAEMWRAANAVICGLVLAASAIIALVVIAISLLLAFDARSPSTAGRKSVEAGHI